MAAAYNDTLFRATFPEFASTTAYPEPLLSGYYGTATVFIDSTGSPFTVLGHNPNALALVLNQMTAHLLTLGKQALEGAPGSNQGGFDVSASIGEISVQKLAPPAKDAWDWWLYQTQYGQAVMALLSTLAVGGLSVGGINERNSFRKAGGIFF